MNEMQTKSNLKIAAIGGGTGLSTMLRGLRTKFSDITAIVSVADDGGSSGVLRREYHMLPPGDIRNCISALADVGEELGDFLNFRFENGQLAGHAMGNLMLAAFNEMSGSFEEAVNKFCRVFQIDGTVLPVTDEDVVLSAVLTNGMVVDGESNVGHEREDGSKIHHVYLTPGRPKASSAAVAAIENADLVIMGPGSLYTSVIPNLLADGVCEAIKKSKGKRIYVCNVMTQPGETDGYSAYDHLKALEAHSYPGIADFVLVNSQPIPPAMEEKYKQRNSYLVKVDEEKFEQAGVTLVKGNILLVRDEYVRHNFSRLARAIQKIARM